MWLFHLQFKVLDDWIAKEALARLFELFARGVLVCAGQLDFQVLANMHAADALIAHVLQGVLDCFALRVKDRLLRRDYDLRFHH